eukprot:TRINITY_DN4525_c1_g1_i1.p1 TRINITY_DN4525_c1_g1~~TRINITY_DN4525_c1_g1_i1.p1  ORF type:complete len:266 (-),score=60.17 TRINITY_DN4525_c1_g1_i1:1434-2231(-)
MFWFDDSEEEDDYFPEELQEVMHRLPYGYGPKQVLNSTQHRKGCTECGKSHWYEGEWYVTHLGQPRGADKICMDCLYSWVVENGEEDSEEEDFLWQMQAAEEQEADSEQEEFQALRFQGEQVRQRDQQQDIKREGLPLQNQQPQVKQEQVDAAGSSRVKLEEIKREIDNQEENQESKLKLEDYDVKVKMEPPDEIPFTQGIYVKAEHSNVEVSRKEENDVKQEGLNNKVVMKAERQAIGIKREYESIDDLIGSAQQVADKKFRLK